MKTLQADKLLVKIYGTRDEMGVNAAKDIAECIKSLLKKKEEINMIFAAAPSQNEVLKALMQDKSVEWNRINAFHMDEYIGIDKNAPQSFAVFLKNAIFDKVPFKSVNLIDCTAEPNEEAKRYSALLEKFPTDIVCMGIGENGHIAFNDPHVADFNDEQIAKIVDLDDVCRMQQVHDGCFAKIDDVPKYALTLTCPTLSKATYRFCVVPAPSKANAVKNTVYGEVDEKCPATVLRITDNSVMYCDKDSAELL
ncbi:MAG: glucosamine-6-phosphate deaminase [Clostridia bacterium]|nr:glucosamine-6-phosphate deaminase [Clostridia bacterium]